MGEDSSADGVASCWPASGEWDFRAPPTSVQFGGAPNHMALTAKVLLQVQCGPCAAALRCQGIMRWRWEPLRALFMVLSSDRVGTFSEPSGRQQTPRSKYRHVMLAIRVHGTANSAHAWSEPSALLQLTDHRRRKVPTSLSSASAPLESLVNRAGFAHLWMSLATVFFPHRDDDT